MSIMFLSSTDVPSGQIIEFNIESAKDSKNKDLKKINDLLVLYKDLSFGKISKRRDNGDFWYINPKETIARFITKAQLELFFKWDNETLLLSDKQFEILSEIGGVPTSQYSLYPDNIEFPALVTTASGQQIDLCLLHFSKSPPFQRHFKKVILLNDIVDIRPSELALTHDLRLSSMLADEMRMGFWPFMVRTNSRKIITYNGVTQFASTGELKGKDIISQVEFSYDKFDSVKDVSYDDITFVVGKWDNRLGELFKQYRIRVDRKTATNSTLPKAGRSWWQKLFGS